MDSYLDKLKIKNLTAKRVIQSKIEHQRGELTSLVYHGIFDYPLTLAELIRWRAGNLAINLPPQVGHQPLTINYKDGFYFLGGSEGAIYKRLLRKRISGRKLEIAKRAGKILGLIPTIRVVAVTGALAMENASEEGDIDLMVVARGGTLWVSRLVALLLLDFFKIPRRKFGDKNQRDKICMNMWLDEDDLILRRRNVYTSHEVAQIVPIVNKDDTYEKFLYKNRWIKEYWPNAVKIKNLKLKIKNYNSKFKIFETFAYMFQRWYMRNKITREVVTPTRALFHPIDWGKVVLKRLSS